MAEATLVQWLMGQAPIIVVLGAILWWVKGKFEESVKEIQRLNDEKLNLAKDVVKMMVIWEQKNITDSEINAELKRLLMEKNEANAELKRLLASIKELILSKKNNV